MKNLELKTGMKVVDTEGTEYIVLKDFEHKYSSDNNILIGKENSWNSLSHYKEDLGALSYSSNIVAVYVPDHVYAIQKFFKNTEEDSDWILVWGKEESNKKSEKSIKLSAMREKVEQLLKDIDDFGQE